MSLYRKATLEEAAQNKTPVVQTPSAVVQKVVQNAPMTTSERQRAWRQAHLEEYRAKNRERMRKLYAEKKAK